MAKYKIGEIIEFQGGNYVIISKKRAKELQKIGLEVYMIGLFGQPMVEVNLKRK